MSHKKYLYYGIISSVIHSGSAQSLPCLAGCDVVRMTGICGCSELRSWIFLDLSRCRGRTENQGWVTNLKIYRTFRLKTEQVFSSLKKCYTKAKAKLEGNKKPFYSVTLRAALLKACKHLLWDRCHADGRVFTPNICCWFNAEASVGTIYVLFVLSLKISICPSHKNIFKEFQVLEQSI